MFQELSRGIVLQIQSGLLAQLRLRGGRPDQGDGWRLGFASRRTCLLKFEPRFKDVRHAR
jgi:hypothetical protein